jgi:hypothetical protein
MRKREAFPTKFFKAVDFPSTPMVLEIEVARQEPFENNGKSTDKTVVYFAKQKSGLVIGPTVWEQIAGVTGKDDSDDWPGHLVELYRDKTPFGGKLVDCIRVRKPGTPPPAKRKVKNPKPPKPDLKPDLDDEINL